MARLVTPPDPVIAELRRWASEPFVWAASDCGLSILGYVERATGRRLPAWPRYRGAVGARKFLRRAGGYPAYARRCMAALGCPETEAPGRGDVGLVELPTGLTACLCLGSFWAARGDRQVVMQPAEPVMAWSVAGRPPCPRP